MYAIYYCQLLLLLLYKFDAIDVIELVTCNTNAESLMSNQDEHL